MQKFAVGVAALSLSTGLMCGGAMGQFESFAGQWEGAWFNDTFETTGAITSDVSVDGMTITMDTDVDGFVFGQFDPPPMTMSITVNGDGTLDFGMGGAGFLGTAAGSFDGENFSMAFTDVGDVGNGPAFELMTVNGSVANGELSATYALFFSASAPSDPFASGRILLSQIPAPATAALLAVGALTGRRRR